MVAVADNTTSLANQLLLLLTHLLKEWFLIDGLAMLSLNILKELTNGIIVQSILMIFIRPQHL